MEPEQAVEKLLADSTFFKTSNGGITLSGGDPLFQGEFNYEVLKLCGLHRIHRTVETALFACPEFLQKFSAEVDLFLCDLKIADPDEHLKILKVSQKVVLRNLNRLIDYGKDIMIRIPLIPAFTATKKNLTGLAVIISGLGRELSVEILNFNPLAEGKFKAMNMIWPFEQKTPFSLAEMDSFRQILRDGGVKGEIK
jgi:pyruvate formate lyase activating enzyme